MALRNITDVKLGSTQVNKIYLGDNLVWQKNVVPIIEPILDLPFQNDFTDLTGINTMVAGRTSNPPTFELSGRKAGEYCAVFNGSQSIKTTTNLPVNSDKVTIAFWMKTSQNTAAAVVEMSPNWLNTNTFVADISNSKMSIGEQTTQFVRNTRTSLDDINDNNWKHIVVVFDRANLISNKITIYINGVSVGTTSSGNGETSGNFTNNILFIGQRGGSSLGFNGSLTRLKFYNYPFTAGEVSTLYNSE